MSDDTIVPDPFNDIKRNHLLSALQKIDPDNIPTNAKSSTYDIVHGGNRYPPKLVVTTAQKREGKSSSWYGVVSGRVTQKAVHHPLHSMF